MTSHLRIRPGPPPHPQMAAIIGLERYMIPMAERSWAWFEYVLPVTSDRMRLIPYLDSLDLLYQSGRNRYSQSAGYVAYDRFNPRNNYQ